MYGVVIKIDEDTIISLKHNLNFKEAMALLWLLKRESKKITIIEEEG